MVNNNKKILTTHNSLFTKFAFTLAETLIVIGIIGVVAALTLPNLNHAMGDKERVTRVKKIYSALNDAYERAQVVYGDADGWHDYAMRRYGEETGYEDGNLFTDRISEFMKVSKKTDNHGEDANDVTLPDGTDFCTYATSPDPSSHYEGLTYLGIVFVDIDGFNKGKNIEGYDRFAFDITNMGIMPEGISDNKINCLFDAGNCSYPDNHYGASRWILENDNMDYLKVDESGVCPDGTQLSWTVTSCN